MQIIEKIYNVAVNQIRNFDIRDIEKKFPVKEEYEPGFIL